MKHCHECGQTKSPDDFHNSSRYKDGKQTRCKACDSIRRKNRLGKYEGPESTPPIYAPLASRPTYRPNERNYTRNDGNKHIQSRGMRC